MNFSKRVLFIILLLIIAPYAKETKWLTPYEYQKILHIGVDVNWATFLREIRHYSPQEAEDFANIGFDHIRIRFKDPRHLRGRVAKREYFKYLKRLVDDVLRSGMTPILAFGAEDFKQNPNKRNMQKALKIWQIVSKEFIGYSPKLAFDLIIEPGKSLRRNPEALNLFYEKAVAKIRKNHPKRIIFIAPPKTAHPESLPLLKIPSKSNGYIMVETHFYAAGPSPTNPRSKWTTGTPKERDIVKKRLQIAINWQNSHHIPIWIGAIMPGKLNKGKNYYSIEEQVNFASFISCLFQKNSIPFAINADSLFYDFIHKEWRVNRLPILNSILKPECK